MHESIAICGLLVASASAKDLLPSASWSELYLEASFAKYCADFKRSYSAAEAVSRKANFARNIAEIRAHNADETQTYRKGTNQFTDWSEEEFAAMMKPRTSKVPRSEPAMGRYNVSSMAGVPKVLDYRTSVPAVLTAVKNQGGCGSCWAHGATETIESAFAFAKLGPVTMLARGQINDCDTEQGGCNGGFASQGVDWVGRNDVGGIYTEEQYPYLASTQSCVDLRKNSSEIKPFVTVKPASHVKKNDGKVMMNALATQGPIGIAICANLGGFMHYDSGIFQEPKGAAYYGLNHEVQLVGYGGDASVAKGQEYWIMRNSWGTRWGEQGFARMWKAGPKQEEPCHGAADAPECGTCGLLGDPYYATAAKYVPQ